MRLTRNLSALVGLCAVLIATSGCVKRRDTLPAQSANLDHLISVEAIKSWNHTIMTEESLEKAAVSEADNLNVETTIEDGIVFPKVVKFDTDSPLLKPNIASIDFYGQPKTPYPVRYKLTPNFLKIYKFVKRDQISHYELPYAEDSGDGYLVPLGGYKATYYNTGYVKNADNRDTNVIDKFLVPSERYASANSISIDFAKFEAFERVDKLDVLPADYFTTGQWYYASSIISTKPGQEQKIGYVDGNVDASLRKLATKIKFVKINNFLRGINVVRDSRIELNEDQADDVINIRVDWEEYRPEPYGNEFELKEEKYTQVTETERTYGKFYFSQTVKLADKSAAEGFLEGVFKGIKVSSLTIKPDSFSFTLIKTSTGEMTKFSFLRVKERNYDPRVYFEYDRKKFGYFTTNKFKLSDHNDHREGDVERNVLLTRFNPKKDIYFKFSTLTPKLADLQKDPHRLDVDYRKVGRQAVKHWNRVFELAGASSRLQILDGDAELGELDVNIINIIDNIGGSGLLGVGPTVTDPETGEVISGTVNVYVGPLINGLSDDIRDYIKIKSGLAKDIGFSKEILASRPLYGYVSREIEQFCPEVKSYAIDPKRPASMNESSQENRIVNACIEKMLPKRVAWVVSHEMGHSPIALRHNFFASSDKSNSFTSMAELEKVYPRAEFPEVYEYYPSAEFLPSGSSVMDYAPYTAPYLVTPGYYDIAAVAYAYTEKLDPSQSLETQATFQGAKRFKYCTDDDVANGLDPLCKKHDYGYDPLEALDFYFNQYRDYLVLYGRKLDRNSAFDYSNMRIGFLNRMAEIYGGWRAYVYDYLGKQQAYLDHLTADSMPAFVEELRTSSSFKQKEYIGVGEKYFGLLSEVLFLPDLYCVTTGPNDQIKLIEFDKLQPAVIAASESGVEKVTGCTDKPVVDHLRLEGLEVVSSIGFPVQELKFSLSPDDIDEPVDFFGLRQERMVAGDNLTGRITSSISYLLRRRDHFQPSAMDEAHLYQNLRQRVTDRLLVGMDVSQLLSNNLKSLGRNVPAKDIPVFKKFESEWSIYQNALVGIVNNTIVPGRAQRPIVQDFFIGITNTRTGIDPGTFVYFNKKYHFAKPEAVFVNQVFEKLLQSESDLYVYLKGATFAQQQAYTSYENLLRGLPSEGTIRADALENLRAGLETLLEETKSSQELAALNKGAATLIDLLARPAVNPEFQLPWNRKALLGEFVKSVSDEAYQDWKLRTETHVMAKSQMDVDENLDVQIQLEKLRSLLTILPGAPN